MRRVLGVHSFGQWCAIGGLLALGVTSHHSQAIEGRVISKEAAKIAIKQAMEAEMRGELLSREQLLSEAAQNKTVPLAQWQSGRMRLPKSDWLSIEEAAARIANSDKMARYEKVRSTQEDTLRGNLAIARACIKAKLAEYATVHFERVLQLDPDHQAAREALGYHHVDGEWISSQQFAQAQKLAQAESAAVEKHGRTMHELLPLLQSTQSWEQERAKHRLKSISDPTATIAAEKILSPVSEQAALATVDFAAQFNHPIATSSLARHAMSHSSAIVRGRAAERLSRCDLHAYAPALLSQLSLPIRSELDAILGPKGEVTGYRQIFQRVAMDKTQVVSTTTNLPKPSASNSDKNSSTSAIRPLIARSREEAREIARASLSEVSLQSDRQVAIQNERIASRNARILDVMGIATRQQLPDDPQAWWNWYESQSGIETEGRDYNESEQMRRLMVDSGYKRLLPARRECFVAGTLVTTHRGSVAIETVRIGDMVLSKDITSGELSFRPVVQRTIRDAEELLAIQAGEELLRCTKGHLFWVSGRGWTKAGDLNEGMILHGAVTPLRIDRIFAGGNEETFNLKVTGNANYFVGNARILSHDVTSRGPSEMAIPGYKAPRDRDTR